MDYQHIYLEGEAIPLPVGKIVCVGRNYLEHIRELENPIPEKPILFMKPATALASLQAPLQLPHGRGSCHHELELAVLIGQRLSQSTPETVPSAVAGFAIALDLTLRDLQDQLKGKGQPWEIAKAFDRSCPVSPFLQPALFPDPQAIEMSLTVNGTLRQQGNTRQMMVGVFDLIVYISHHFTLLPGDLVLTGTPAGVGALHSGDELTLTLGPYTFETRAA